MKPIAKWVWVLTVILAVSLIGSVVYYIYNKKYMGNIAGIYQLQDYKLDIEKTVAIDSPKPVCMVFGQDKLVEYICVIESNYISVRITGSAKSTCKEALPYIFIHDEGDSVYLFIQSGLNPNKEYESEYYRGDYKISIFAPDGCFPVKATNFNQDYWWRALEEIQSNSAEREPSDEEIAGLFDKYIIYLKTHNTNGLVSLFVPYPGITDFSSEEERIKSAVSHFWMNDLLFKESGDYCLKGIKKVNFQGSIQYILTAEFLFHGQGRPADFWFRVAYGKLGIDNFDISW